MMQDVHNWLIRAAKSRKPSCPGSLKAEKFAIDAGYAVYTRQPPLLRLTRLGYQYAERNANVRKTG